MEPEISGRRRWTADERTMLRNFKLIRAFGSGETAWIDGVGFNFACDLDRAEWRPLCPLGAYGRGAGRHAPEIVFPWTPKSWREAYERGGHALRAPKGSLIFIGPVQAAPLDTPFAELDDPDQRGRMLAYVCVMGPDKTAHMARRPLILLPKASSAAHIETGDYGAAFRGMLYKLERVLGYEDIEALASEPQETWPAPRADAPLSYRRAFIALVEAIESCDDKAYAAFGYLMARAEAESRLLGSARHGVRWKDTTSKATSARQKNSRARAEPRLAYAKTIIAGDSDISLSKCARLVGAHFDADPRSVSRQIVELFERRGNRREYRPKRQT